MVAHYLDMLRATIWDVTAELYVLASIKFKFILNADILSYTVTEF